MTRTIAGFFRTRNEGAIAYNDLLANGFDRELLSSVVGDTHGHPMPAGHIQGTTESEVAQDIAMGSAIGLVAGLVLLIIPGADAFLAVGPLALALGGIGAGAGGIIGLLRSRVLSEEKAARFEARVLRGGCLVTVRGVSERDERRAREVMEQNGAIGTDVVTIRSGVKAS